MTREGPRNVEVLIFGGGAAGLWLLDELIRDGRDALLLEAHELGSGQTIASQGIVHGGLKYTLSGLLTSSARAISEMPLLWRRCLAGEREPNLVEARLRAPYCHLWQTTSLRSKVAMVGARAGLRVRPRKLGDEQRPEILKSCPGVVARLEEQVIEPSTLLNTLSERHRGRILKIDAQSGLELRASEPGLVGLVRLINPDTGDSLDLKPHRVVFTAGAGNGGLRQLSGLSARAMQRRPLHMVLARGDLPLLNGHCVDGMKTRVTITSTRDYADRTVWQIGGQLAEDGVDLAPEALVTHAASELAAVLPRLDPTRTEWATYRVDRAEARTGGGLRPDTFSIIAEGNTVTAWPTKMVLVPEMARRISGLLPAREKDAPMPQEPPDWPRPNIAIPPWEEQEQWFSDV
ncbi:MAG: FAD-dependent oxidoreductase [Phycisphaerales bacterium]|nr:MAG: FAD-dependent oxidoreductase [Phycisphaerales bacterium]